MVEIVYRPVPVLLANGNIRESTCFPPSISLDKRCSTFKSLSPPFETLDAVALPLLTVESLSLLDISCSDKATIPRANPAARAYPSRSVVLLSEIGRLPISFRRNSVINR